MSYLRVTWSFTIIGCSEWLLGILFIFTACFLLYDLFAYFPLYVPCLFYFKCSLILQADALNVCSLAGGTVLEGCRTFRK